STVSTCKTGCLAHYQSRHQTRETGRYVCDGTAGNLFIDFYCCNRTGQVYFLLSSITHYNDLIQCLRVFREGYYYIGSTFQGYFLSNVSDERYYKSCIR